MFHMLRFIIMRVCVKIIVMARFIFIKKNTQISMNILTSPLMIKRDLMPRAKLPLNYPYRGTRVHLLIFSKRDVARMEQYH